MKWLELDYDEGPFYQTERYSLYKDKIKELLAKAVKPIRVPVHQRSWMPSDSWHRKRNANPPMTAPCRPPEGVIPSLPTDKSYVVRFRSPAEGSTVVRDLIRAMSFSTIASWTISSSPARTARRRIIFASSSTISTWRLLTSFVATTI